MEYTTTLSEHQPIAITIGNFDGIHKGHQRLLHELRDMAQELNCTPTLVTFVPHTLMVVRPDIHVEYLTALEEKLTLAKQYGSVPDSIVVHFTPAVAAMSASEFLDELRGHFPIRGMVVGANFSLGHKRMGDVAFLERYGQAHEIIVRTIALEADEQARISSTRIRALVKEGQVAEANDLLGHLLTMSGRVVHGDERGKLLGFPTANLLPDAHRLLPANGVYAVRVRVSSTEVGDEQSSSSVYNGVANIGVRPTFNGTERRVEVHLLDVELDLYDKYLFIDFVARLRSEQRFSGIDALKAQITADVEQARQILQHDSTQTV
ncbi:MAG TPA: bifunctional riboflavin kinase/FAD synthetase [Ktedonobacteraceae bacterium]|nr:bifunctional riboflavin kinase/FAD synthetase [Ktedonobacteraceae bacterium]